jgi:cyclohexanone monooxygenase
MLGSTDCTPGYYNNEGQPDSRSGLFVGYPAGAMAFFRYIDEWRSNGEFKGLAFD